MGDESSLGGRRASSALGEPSRAEDEFDEPDEDVSTCELLHGTLHDAKNALSAVNANVAFVRDMIDPVDDEVQESLSDLAQGARRIRQALDDLALVAQLQSFERADARESGVRTVRVPLRGAFDAVVRPMQQALARRRVNVVPEGDEGAYFATDPLLLRRAIEIALDQAMASAASMSLVVRAEEPDAGRGVATVLVVRSSAPLFRARAGGRSANEARLDLVRRVLRAQGGCSAVDARGLRFVFPSS